MKYEQVCALMLDEWFKVDGKCVDDPHARQVG